MLAYIFMLGPFAYNIEGVMKRRFLLLLTAFVFTVSYSGCGAEWKYDPITDVNDLNGRTVACNIGWETDYALSGRSDLKVIRYDLIADMIMALRFNKVDAVAVDELIMKSILNGSTGVECVYPGFGTSGYTLYFNPDKEVLKDEFNEFLRKYKESPAYDDHLQRLSDYDGMDYTGPEIELTGTGKVLKVAYDAGAYPRAFANADSDEPLGFDLEAIKYFANENDYRLVFYPSNYNDILFGLLAGIYDVGAGYLSDVYEYAVLERGLFTSEPLDRAELVFIQKTEQDISVNTGDLD